MRIIISFICLKKKYINTFGKKNISILKLQFYYSKFPFNYSPLLSIKKNRKNHLAIERTSFERDTYSRKERNFQLLLSSFPII